jgi:hypothetical protein
MERPFWGRPTILTPITTEKLGLISLHAEKYKQKLGSFHSDFVRCIDSFQLFEMGVN